MTEAARAEYRPDGWFLMTGNQRRFHTDGSVALVEFASRLLLKWTGGKAFKPQLFGNREELRALMHESAAAFTGEEQAMISRALDLQSLTVRQVEIPMAQVVTVMMGAPLSEVFRLCADRHLTRLPVWQEQGGQRRVAGLLAQPESLFTTAAQTLDYQFGFKVSETWFYRFAEQAVGMVALAQILVLGFSTCVVFIDAGEEGLLERFGTLGDVVIAGRCADGKFDMIGVRGHAGDAIAPAQFQ